jgi:hypothetical protein
MPTPYSAYTGSTEFVANYLYTKLLANAGPSGFNLGGVANGQAGVWYGDTSGLLPATPMMCVIPGPTSSVYNGVGGRPVLKTFTTFVMVYYGKVQDQQANVHASLTLADAVEKFVNPDITLGGNVIDCMCAAVEPGVAVKGGALIDATRMTFRTRSKVTLNAS